MNKEWTVEDLRSFLSHLPAEAKVKLQDADTNWTINKFNVVHDTKDNEVWFFPSDYGDMIR